MSDDQRVYSDEDFGLILRKATEMASRTDSTATVADGLTLAEMKAAAAQVGFDPALVERAALLLAESAPATPLDRLFGGPVHHQRTLHLPVALDEPRAAMLLSAIRISAGLAGRRDNGHSSAMGMSWHDGGDTESLSVTARPDEHGTAVTIALDRRGTLGVVAMVSGITLFLSLLFAMFALHPEAPALGFGGGAVAIAGVLGMARSYWVNSTTRARSRISAAIDTVGKMLTTPSS